MAEVAFARDIACGRDRIRELLLNRDLLTQFVTKQHPIEYDVGVDPDTWSSTVTWVISTDGIPRVFRGLVGGTVPIRLVIVSRTGSPDEDGSVHVDVDGKVAGRLRAALRMTPVDQDTAHTALAIRGPLEIRAGLLGGKASSMSRDHVILPMLGQLTDLIEQWCAG